MSYNHLTLEERYHIAELKAKKYSIRKIAKILNRSASTISREFGRNSSKKGYNPYGAHCKATHRKRLPRKLVKQYDAEKLEYVITSLREKFWTPEEIVGRWRSKHPDSALSCSTIYRHIKRGLLPDIHPKLHLRRRGKRKVNRKAKYNTIQPDRIIPDWPEEIKQRLRIGDWEGDSIVGASGKGAAVTLVDRKSGFVSGFVVQTRQASETREAIRKALENKPIRSLSFDNGAEFAEFRELEKELKVPVFFAEPHKPWQRGCNENANGLLRFFFPKGCNFLEVSQEEFSRVLNLINNRPRKRLNWRTPFEVFFENSEVESVALA